MTRPARSTKTHLGAGRFARRVASGPDRSVARAVGSLLLVAALVSGACGLARGPESIVVPSAADVASIGITVMQPKPGKAAATSGATEPRDLERTIVDRSAIERALRLLSEANDGDWSRAQGSFATPEVRAVLYDREQKTLFVVWLGSDEDWVGARSHAGDHQENLYWDAPRERRLELRKVLGIESK